MEVPVGRGVVAVGMVVAGMMATGMVAAGVMAALMIDCRTCSLSVVISIKLQERR